MVSGAMTGSLFGPIGAVVGGAAGLALWGAGEVIGNRVTDYFFGKDEAEVEEVEDACEEEQIKRGEADYPFREDEVGAVEEIEDDMCAELAPVGEKGNISEMTRAKVKMKL